MVFGMPGKTICQDDVQKKDTNKRASETRTPPKSRKNIINKTSYFLSNSLNKSLHQK
jgi:hypothetical protein